MNSSSIKKKKNSGNFVGNFFKNLEFMELKLHGKLEFHKHEFQNSDRLIYILVNSNIWPFSPKNNVKQSGNIIST